jgi:diguanylate cyclase (GGDEF)-like protein
MPELGDDVERFVLEFDAAIESHLSWTRRVLRCAVLRTSPGEDVLAADAHCRCRFGRWFTQKLALLESVDAAASARVLTQHEHMHDAVRSLCTALLAGEPGNARDLDQFETTQSALVTDLAGLKTRILSHAARLDALTGLPLRYGLEDEFDRARALDQRNGQLLVVMLADIDHFKNVNDSFGHALGDQALLHVAKTLRAAIRRGEPVFRFGGEEFLLLLHAVDRPAAQVAAQRILQAVRDAPGPVAGSRPLQLRISAGLCAAGPDETMAQAVARADHAMYAAKHGGRDRWVWGVE